MNGTVIGKDVAVQTCTDTALEGLRGTAVDETLHTITIVTGMAEKTVLKHTATFSIDQQHVEGTTLQRRPEDAYK